MLIDFLIYKRKKLKLKYLKAFSKLKENFNFIKSRIGSYLYGSFIKTDKLNNIEILIEFLSDLKIEHKLLYQNNDFLVLFTNSTDLQKLPSDEHNENNPYLPIDGAEEIRLIYKEMIDEFPWTEITSEDLNIENLKRIDDSIKFGL